MEFPRLKSSLWIDGDGAETILWWDGLQVMVSTPDQGDRYIFLRVRLDAEEPEWVVAPIDDETDDALSRRSISIYDAAASAGYAWHVRIDIDGLSADAGVLAEGTLDELSARLPGELPAVGVL